tara:strand:+ start:811 stop:1329 length:519 start_codon:yes stop_codon:yes gene_type:complete
MTHLKVRLTKQEMLECKQAATLRWQLSRAMGVPNQRKDTNRNDNDVDQLGIKGETAVAKVLECRHNVFQYSSDYGVDMFLGNISIDVKTTFHQTGKLLFKSLDAFKAGCSVLVTASDDDDVMIIAGYIPRRVFLEKAQETDLGGYGPCFTMEQIYLRPIESLWKRHQEKKFQ